MTLYALPSYRMTPRSFIYGPNGGVNQTGTPNTKAYERQQKKNRNITIASVLTAAALVFLGKKTKVGKALIGKLKNTKVGQAVSDFCKNSKAVKWIKDIPGKIKGLFTKGANKADDVLEGTVEDIVPKAIKKPQNLLPAGNEVLGLPAPKTITSEAGDKLIKHVDDIANNPPPPKVIYVEPQKLLEAPKTIVSEAGDTFTDGAGI